MQFRTGPFVVCYEKGFLRYLQYGNAEILRMVYFAFRDENWGTLPYELADQAIYVGESSFSVRYQCFNVAEGRRVFRWNAEIVGSADGEITFTLEGTALETIRKNRAGFCIHHPVREVAGEPVEITTPDGAKYKGIFPANIAPDNPFRGISAMRWRCGDNWYSLSFSGDVFETEDQRNWTDASFKTFCTPLDEPFPVELSTGQQIRQQVVFRPERRAAPVVIGQHTVELTTTGPPLPRLPVGTFLPIDATNASAALDTLEALGFTHYRLDLLPGQPQWREVLRRAIDLLKARPARLELALHLTPGMEAEAELVLDHLAGEEGSIWSIGLYPAPWGNWNDRAEALLEKWQRRYPGVVLGLGTDYNFAEVNRNRVAPGLTGFVSFGIQPQEHAFDDLSLIENLAAQADAIESLKIAAGASCQARVSPVTLKKRFNPYATDPRQLALSQHAQTDARLHAPFGAVWTLGSIRYLAQSGCSSATYFQGIGPLGIIGENLTPTPVYEALALYHQSSPAGLLASRSNAPLRADGLFFDDGTAIVWNYTGGTLQVTLPHRQTIRLEGYGFRQVRWDAPPGGTL